MGDLTSPADNIDDDWLGDVCGEESLLILAAVDLEFCTPSGE